MECVSFLLVISVGKSAYTHYNKRNSNNKADDVVSFHVFTYLLATKQIKEIFDGGTGG